MTCKKQCLIALIVTVLFAGGTTLVAQDASAENSAAESNASDAKDEKKESDVVKLQGVFESTESHEIKLELKEWTALTVVESVEHGDRVQKSDSLITLDTDKIDTAITDAEDTLKIDSLALEEAELKLEMAKRSQPLTLKAAEDADRVATEELKDYLTRGRERRVKGIQRSVKMARNRLAYQQEELNQLEKMYKADDLTEETEEIILQRTRDAVESAQYSLELALESEKTAMDFSVPREEEKLKDAVKKAAIALDEAKENLPRQIKQQELNLEKQKVGLEKKRENLNRLRADRELMNVTAPADGIVYYGACKRGQWSDSSTIAASLQPGGSIKPKTVLMTIVKPAPLKVRVSVPETSLRFVKPGTSCVVKPVAFPDTKLSATVASISNIPISSGTFDAVLDVDLQDMKGRIMPGMKADVEISKAK